MDGEILEDYPKMCDLESTNSFFLFNSISNKPTQPGLLSIFHIDSYIRINRFYVSPFSLISLKSGLARSNLQFWEFSPEGWRLFFKNSVVDFRGRLESCIKENKIIYIKIDCGVGGPRGNALHGTVMRYIKCFDTFYFMTAEMDMDLAMMTNPLVYNKEHLFELYRRYDGRRRGADKEDGLDRMDMRLGC